MKPSPIQELDPNSNKIDPETGLRWYDIQMFGVKGQGWADTQRPYARLSVWQLAQHSPGLCLHITGCLQHQMSLSQSLRMDSGEHVEEFLYADIGGLGEVAADFLAFMLAYSAHG